MAINANVNLLEVLVQKMEEVPKEVHFCISVLSSTMGIYFLSNTYLKNIREKFKVATDEELKTLNEIYILSGRLPRSTQILCWIHC